MTARTRELCIMACVFCKSADFRDWLAEGGERATEGEAKAVILSLCKVTSRNALDTDPIAAELFHELVRKPFLEWKEAQAQKASLAAFCDVQLGEPWPDHSDVTLN